MGVPNNPEFQTRVLKSVLKLLEFPQGPVLEDFPEDAPDVTDHPVPMACPVNFTPPKKALSSREMLVDSFSLEFSQMRTWYDLALSNNSRSTTGISGLEPEAAAAFIAAFVKGEESEPTIRNHSLPDSLRMAAEDIKAFYFKGVSAQPGQSTDSKTLANWFWGETYAALVINEMRKISLTQGSDQMKLLGTLLLVPRSQMHRFKD